MPLYLILCVQFLGRSCSFALNGFGVDWSECSYFTINTHIFTKAGISGANLPGFEMFLFKGPSEVQVGL